MKWWLKAGIQKSISFLPGGRRIHHFLQQKVWRSLQLSDAFLIDRLSHVDKHLRAWEQYHPHSQPQIVLELGTGWYPVVPLGMYLSGIDQIYTVDQSSYLSEARFAELLAYLANWQARGLLQKYLPSLKIHRWQSLRQLQAEYKNDFSKLLEALQIHYWLGDARTLPYSARQFDLIHSNNTFEHIPPSILGGLISEMKRVMKVEGVMSHYIDMVDHYSYGDPSLSPLHFLRFTERQWSWIENRFQSQNRMRLNQYEDLFAKLGLKALPLHLEFAAADEVKDQKLAFPYSSFPPKKVEVLYAHLMVNVI
ncbi:MAG: class I SAM-dependent methyltransferase [Bacteroidota bacterium]